jgi:DnaK suppressor protein
LKSLRKINRRKKKRKRKMAARKTKKSSKRETGNPARKKTGRVKTTVAKTSFRTKPEAAGRKKAVSKKTVARKTVVRTKPKPAPKRKKAAEKKVPGKLPAKKRQKTVSGAKRPVRLLAPKPGSKEFEDERRTSLRKSLVSKREQIVREAKAEISKYIKGETRQLVDTALDDGDWSVVDLSEDVSLRRLSAHRENLQRIDEALRKFDEGTYGICEDCGEEIGGERLKILPFAIYCTDCQEKREQLEQIERSES